MASIIYRTNHKTGAVYAYRSESYRDPVTKKPRNKRTYLGRVEPETKKIIPKNDDKMKNRSGKRSVLGKKDVIPRDVGKELFKLRRQVKKLERENALLQEKIETYDQILLQLRTTVDGYYRANHKGKHKKKASQDQP